MKINLNKNGTFTIYDKEILICFNDKPIAKLEARKLIKKYMELLN